MEFRKKKSYEDIYKWHRSNNGTCFYCYEDAPVAAKLVGERGICQECLAHFRVGHVGTDRHVITHLTKGLRSHDETVAWLRKQSVKLAPNGEHNGIRSYLAINNLGIFDYYHDIIYGSADIAEVDEKTARKIMDSYNAIEIYQDGAIRICY
ncbi:hypothetical protein [Azotosporobacter soli]|uniref:hypothetical protein n=1 Tax=Azotosporobacter soli TaxID=3055040 RepID=UPI0031FF1EA6